MRDLGLLLFLVNSYHSPVDGKQGEFDKISGLY